MTRLSLLFSLATAAFAFPGGADPGHAGVPGERTCASSSCHTFSLNGPGGSVTVEFPAGLTYAPGVRQRLRVRIEHPDARAYGYQLTVRTASNSRISGGSLTPAGPESYVWCTSPDFSRNTQKPTGGECPAGQTIEHITHSDPIDHPSNTFDLFWDPPAAGATGDVIVYVAANAANGNLHVSGDRIFTNRYTLTAALTARPAVSREGILQAAAFGGGARISPGTWIEIYGTQLRDARVTVGGLPATVAFSSFSQLNVRIPEALAAGPSTLTVTNSIGASDPIPIQLAERSPGLLVPPEPVRAGGILVAYGIGFGVAPTVEFEIGGRAAEALYAGPAPGFPGLFQFNLRIPDGLPAGRTPIRTRVAGVGEPLLHWATLE